jgi:hypothetical protein
VSRLELDLIMPRGRHAYSGEDIKEYGRALQRHTGNSFSLEDYNFSLEEYGEAAGKPRTLSLESGAVDDDEFSEANDGDSDGEDNDEKRVWFRPNSEAAEEPRGPISAMR